MTDGKVKLATPRTYEDWEYAHERGICTDGCPVCKSNIEYERSRKQFDMIPQTPGAATLERTLHDRGEQYGEYSVMAAVAQNLKLSMRSGPMWQHLESFEQEALEVIATKIARIVCGEPLQRDSWHDIGGYARLSEDRCPVHGPATP